MDSPFFRPDSRDYADILADAAGHVIAGGGIDRFSVRGMARWMKINPATLLAERSRARILEIVIIRFEARWLAWSGSVRMYGQSGPRIPLRLPSTPDEVLGVRWMSALQLLAEAEQLRGNSAPMAHLDRLRGEELALLKHQLRPPCCTGEPDDVIVQAVMAIVTGLRTTLAQGDDPGLSAETATALLAGFAEPAVQHDEVCDVARLAS